MTIEGIQGRHLLKAKSGSRLQRPQSLLIPGVGTDNQECR